MRVETCRRTVYNKTNCAFVGVMINILRKMHGVTHVKTQMNMYYIPITRSFYKLPAQDAQTLITDYRHVNNRKWEMPKQQKSCRRCDALQLVYEGFYWPHYELLPRLVYGNWTHIQGCGSDSKPTRASVWLKRKSNISVQSVSVQSVTVQSVTAAITVTDFSHPTE